jgi:hypothetical protein
LKAIDCHPGRSEAKSRDGAAGDLPKPGRRSRAGLSVSPHFAVKVQPAWIVLLDQSELPFSQPALDALFPQNRLLDVLMRLVPDQLVNAAVRRVAGISPDLCSATRRTMSFVTPT